MTHRTLKPGDVVSICDHYDETLIGEVGVVDYLNDTYANVRLFSAPDSAAVPCRRWHLTVLQP